MNLILPNPISYTEYIKILYLLNLLDIGNQYVIII